jgi:hypothetical protein
VVVVVVAEAESGEDVLDTQAEELACMVKDLTEPLDTEQVKADLVDLLAAMVHTKQVAVMVAVMAVEEEDQSMVQYISKTAEAEMALYV